jgi:hypothetical protein
MSGEVIASTFDRPPAEHVAVAELAVERAKRLVAKDFLEVLAELAPEALGPAKAASGVRDSADA